MATVATVLVNWLTDPYKAADSISLKAKNRMMLADSSKIGLDRFGWGEVTFSPSTGVTFEVYVARFTDFEAWLNQTAVEEPQVSGSRVIAMCPTGEWRPGRNWSKYGHVSYTRVL